MATFFFPYQVSMISLVVDFFEVSTKIEKRLLNMTVSLVFIFHI